MSRHEDLDRVLKTGIVAILRAPTSDQLAGVARALFEGGIDIIEVTFTVPNALESLAAVKMDLGSRVLLGMGTVLDPESARAALLVGAEFLVSPSLNLDVIRLCHRYDKLMMPGAFTPTEILTAWDAGADIVKVFPSDCVGPGYLKALKGPFPQIHMIPTGGVSLGTAKEFLEAEAFALGVGSDLVNHKAMAEGKPEIVTESARKYLAIVNEHRVSV